MLLKSAQLEVPPSGTEAFLHSYEAGSGGANPVGGLVMYKKERSIWTTAQSEPNGSGFDPAQGLRRPYLPNGLAGAGEIGREGIFPAPVGFRRDSKGRFLSDGRISTTRRVIAPSAQPRPKYIRDRAQDDDDPVRTFILSGAPQANPLKTLKF